MLIYKGRIVQYGDIQETSYIASCRKSVLAMIYGKYVQSGKISLDKLLRDLQIEDVGGLLSSEKDVTVKDILSARSGVFHPAGYAGDCLEHAPARGSVTHGTYWLYNNWDFNVAGHVFEKQTGRGIYDEVDRVLAKPLQMQDWDLSIQAKAGDTTKSIYKAYPMKIFTRDMGRIGVLMLNKGEWRGKQIIDRRWMESMVKVRTSYSEVDSNCHLLKGTGTILDMAICGGYGKDTVISVSRERIQPSGHWDKQFQCFRALMLLSFIRPGLHIKERRHRVPVLGNNAGSRKL